MSFGKFFTSCFTGSMVGAGPTVFAVWAYVIAHTQRGQVELNPKLLAPIIGCEISDIEEAIAYLCAPDPESRNKQFEGKRLIKEGQFAYKVVSFDIYRAIQNEEERREYNRKKQQEYRERNRQSRKNTRGNASLTSVTREQNVTSPSVSASSSDSSIESTSKEEKKHRTNRFVAPKIDEVKLCGAKAGLPDSECEKLFNYYESNGWRVGKNPMRSLPHAVANWKLNWQERTLGKTANNSNNKSDRIFLENRLKDLKEQERELAGKVSEEWFRNANPDAVPKLKRIRDDIEAIREKQGQYQC